MSLSLVSLSFSGSSLVSFMSFVFSMLSFKSMLKCLSEKVLKVNVECPEMVNVLLVCLCVFWFCLLNLVQREGEEDCLIDEVVHGDKDEDEVTVHVDGTNEHVVDDEDTVTVHRVGKGVVEEGAEVGVHTVGFFFFLTCTPAFIPPFKHTRAYHYS